MALLGVVGVAPVASGDRIGAAFGSAFAPTLGLDPLSGFFLAVLALTAVQRWCLPVTTCRGAGAPAA